VYDARGGMSVMDTSLGERVANALAAWFALPPHFCATGDARGVVPPIAVIAPTSTVELDVDALVVRLFREEGHSLVRLARLFVDDRNAAEDLVQEAFIRLARHAHRIADPNKAAAYLRSIVLNLARDHNRRGLMSLRHHEPADVELATVEEELILREDQRRVIAAMQQLPRRQRDCLVLRYHFEVGIADIADTLGISQNSVKPHLKRGLAAMERHLEDEP
jgi:RNA polymerase sigma factor (sigma-70 family)